MELFNVYSLYPVEPVRGKSCFVYDAAGTEYLDLYGGHAVISIGHAQPDYVRALSEQAARLARTSGLRRIHVVPTTTIPQGISAMMAYDESAEIKDNVEAMQEAASRVQSGSVTFAARDSDYDGHQIKEGELLALENGKVAFTGTDLGSVTAKVAKDLMREDSQFITLLYGADVSEEQAADVEEAVRSLLPEEVELTLAYGGQPVYYFLISVE